MEDAFYTADGDWFESSDLTRGPWDPEAQHAGPPSALVARALERHPSPLDEPEAGWQIGRITYEILRAVPIAPLRVTVEVVRPGRSVELLSASLADEQGEVVRAAAWRLARGAVELPAGLASTDAGSPARRPDPLPGPMEGSEEAFFATGHDVGYHTGMEYRFVAGRFLEPGPATVWMRMRHPLVAGEQPSPLQRRAGRGRLGQRGQRRARLVALPVHQRRPERPPAPDAGDRVGGARRDHDRRSRPASASPTPRSTTSSDRSGGHCRPYSCASAERPGRRFRAAPYPPDRR